MDPYEITFIVRPDIDDEATRGAVDTVRRRIETAGGEILAAYPWGPGRRRLAYPINDFGDGYYYTIDFNFNPQAVRDFERALQLDDNILRSLVVTASDLMVKNSQQRVQQQAQQAAQAAAQAQAAAAAPAPSPASGSGPAMPGNQPAPVAPEEGTPAAESTLGTEEAPEGIATPQGGEQPSAEQSVEQPVAEQTGEEAAQTAAEPEAIAVVDETAVATDPGLPEEEAPLPPVVIAEPASSEAIATLPEDETVSAETQPAGSTEGE